VFGCLNFENFEVFKNLRHRSQAPFVYFPIHLPKTCPLRCIEASLLPKHLGEESKQTCR